MCILRCMYIGIAVALTVIYVTEVCTIELFVV
jgi:hypothetical protein